MGAKRNNKVESVKPGPVGTQVNAGSDGGRIEQSQGPSQGTDGQSQPAAADTTKRDEYGYPGNVGTPNAGSESANAADTGGTAESGTKRRGGWPKGKPRGPRQTSEAFPSYLKWFVGPMLMLHELAAYKLDTPELEIDEPEAKAICSAGDEVLAFYGKVPSPEMQVWIGFASAIGVVYGPRWVAIRTRIRREAKEREARKVQPLRPVNPADAFPPPEPVA